MIFANGGQSEDPRRVRLVARCMRDDRSRSASRKQSADSGPDRYAGGACRCNPRRRRPLVGGASRFTIARRARPRRPQSRPEWRLARIDDESITAHYGDAGCGATIAPTLVPGGESIVAECRSGGTNGIGYVSVLGVARSEPSNVDEPKKLIEFSCSVTGVTIDGANRRTTGRDGSS
jgi:hypothetical protein